MNEYQQKYCLRPSFFGVGCVFGRLRRPHHQKSYQLYQRPPDTAGAIFSFVRPVDALNDREQQSCESKVQIELEKLELVRAQPTQVGRMQIDVIVGNSTRNKQFREPIYRDHYRFACMIQWAMFTVVFGHQIHLVNAMEANER